MIVPSLLFFLVTQLWYVTGESTTSTTISQHGKSTYEQMSKETIQLQQERVLTLLQQSMDDQRKLQQSGFDRICTFVEEQFDGAIFCDCVVDVSAGFIGYTCEFVEPICVSSVCGTASTSGSIDVKTSQATGQFCFVNVSIMSPDDIVEIADTCIDLTYDLTTVGTGEIGLTCLATIGGVLCSSCNPCQGGIALDCSNIVDDGDDTTCQILNVVDGLQLGRQIESNHKVEPFVPQFLNKFL